MCGRYFIEADDFELCAMLAEAEQNRYERQSLFTSGEIFPTDVAPVRTAAGARYMTWGFPSLYGKQPHINARSETAATAPTFREATAARRCIVPASGYFEWKKLDGKRKEKYAFTLPGHAVMYMAGIYSEDGRFAILTRDAPPEISEIHDRMPVIIPRELADDWLSGGIEILSEAVTDLRVAPVTASGGLPSQMSLF
ncbi:MAG: SOS response-associated peptidase [Oscillospiraceae bacterium]|nr:SOS response-associated peptidase [Oscillospiraceae bacterium]